MSCWYRSDVRQDEFRLSQAALLLISKVLGYDHVCSWWSAGKRHKNPSYKATVAAGFPVSIFHVFGIT